MVNDQARPKTDRALKGILLGAISGPVALGGVAWVYLVVSALSSSVPIGEALSAAGLTTAVTVLVFGFPAAILGASVGVFGGVSSGGLGAGVDWLIVVGAASLLGAWGLDQSHQAFDGAFVLYVIPVTIAGGIVGFLTWVLFRVKGTKQRFSSISIIGYLVTFLLGLTLGPCAGATMLLIFFD